MYNTIVLKEPHPDLILFSPPCLIDRSLERRRRKTLLSFSFFRFSPDYHVGRRKTNRSVGNKIINPIFGRYPVFSSSGDHHFG